MGPSGSGKSTLARLLIGRLLPRAGQVLIGDVAVARLPDRIKAELVGYLPQHPALFGGSVRDNIARMEWGDVDAVIDAAKLAGIHDAIVRLPQGYDTVLDSDAPELSGGERKRIALARAFYGRPRLVVLDEPEAALDRASRRVLRRALQTLRDGGSTVVVTTQSGRLARSADRALILGGDRPRLVDGDEAVAPLPTKAPIDDLEQHRRLRSDRNRDLEAVSPEMETPK
jgi:ABC-type protease/lipase transport system fused ATPase/permease subunit